MAITKASRSAREARTPLPRLVWVLAGGSFVNNLGGFVVPFLVVYLVHRGYSAGLAAAAVSGYAAGKMAAGPVGGLLIERLGTRATTAGSMAGSAAATLALAVVSGPVPTIVTAALVGLVSQLYRPATSAMLAAAVPGPQRVRAFSVYQLGVSAGAAAGPAIGGMLAERSFLILFSCDAATSLAWAILAWRVLPGTGAETSGRPHPQSSGPGMLGDRRLARLLAVTLLANLILFQAQTTLPLWMHRQGLSTGSYGLLLALNSGLVMALQLPAARLTRRARPEPVIAATSVLIGAGFGLLPLARTPVLLAAAVTVWSLGELAQWPVAAAYTTTLAPPGMTGRYASARSLCYGAALLLAPLTGTALYRLSPALLWGACAAAGICAAAVITLPAMATANSAPTRNTRQEEVMTTAQSAAPYIRQVGEHQQLAYTGGAELAVILDAAITGGQLTVIESHSRRGDASPVHVHSRDDEAFLLLDGEMTIWVGQERHLLRPGGIAFLPRNIPHAVRCDTAARALVLSTPAGFQEAVFRSAGWDLSRPMPEGWQPAQDAIRRAAEHAGVTLIGPPHRLDDYRA
jgi:MFS family permease